MIIAVNNPNQATGKKKPEKNQASPLQPLKLDNLLQ